MSRRLLAPLRRALASPGMEPDFLVIGTKRGGSTSCYQWIASHPQVAPCRTGKGTHYFDVNYPRGEAWFRTGFPTQRDPWRLTGEGSPYYMFHPRAVERIAATLPKVKLVAVLRDPVERAWSHYKYEVARGHERLDFGAALDAEAERLRGEELRLLADDAYISEAHRYYSYLRRGHYAEQLVRVFEHVGRDRVLLLRSEELFVEPHRELNKVWDFLGVDRVELPELRAFKAGTLVSSVPEAEGARLREYYRPHNARLRDLVGIDVDAPVGQGFS